MQLAERRVARQQVVRLRDAGGYDVGERREVCEQLLRLLAEKVLVQLFCGGVDGHDARLLLRCVVCAEDLPRGDLRHGELAVAAVGVLDLARDKEAQAGLEFLLEVFLVEPRNLQKARAVAERGREDGHAA